VTRFHGVRTLCIVRFFPTSINGKNMGCLYKSESQAISRRAGVLFSGLLTLFLMACSEPPDTSSGKTSDQLSASTDTVDAADATVLAEVWPALAKPWTGDLDGMLERGEIRLLTTFTLGTYFIDQGQPRGMVVESAEVFKKFIKKKLGTRARNLKLVIIPVRRDQLLPSSTRAMETSSRQRCGLHHDDLRRSIFRCRSRTRTVSISSWARHHRR
jgi:hypothetical protein